MLLVANLDVETELAAGRARRSLSREALQATIRAGMVLSALGSREDVVWLPGSPGSLRLAPVPGLEPVTLLDGPLPTTWDGPVIAWGETRATAALGTGEGPAGESRSQVLDALLSVSRPDPVVVALANRKTWLIQLRNELGCTLPGSGIVRSPDDLVHLTAACRKIHGEGSRWVLKGEYSAAGRERVLGRAGAGPGPGSPGAVLGLLRRHGACLYEPWHHRTADYGCSLLVEQNRTRLAAVHRLMISDHGRFLGVETILNGDKEPGPEKPDGFQPFLAPEEAARMSEVASGTGEALARIGYRGHVGIDFWSYRAGDGIDRINLLGEVNARLTFGLVAAVLAQRTGPAMGAVPGTPVRLRFGRQTGGANRRRLTLVDAGAGSDPVVTLSIP